MPKSMMVASSPPDTYVLKIVNEEDVDEKSARVFGKIFAIGCKEHSVVRAYFVPF